MICRFLPAAGLVVSAVSVNSLTASPIQTDAELIFNALHSSMRQFGSSLNHNGMSVFLASVPPDTQLYHGNGNSDSVTGMEWLAFEPEHAMIFAWRNPWSALRGLGQQLLRGPNPESRKEAHLPHGLLADGQTAEREPGWLHIYRTKHELRLLYIDGMSAGKTENGTLDTQDYMILAGDAPIHLDDLTRAEQLCRLAEKDWEGKIDGFLRMETGFEIILCSFQQHLDQIRVERTNKFRNWRDKRDYDMWFDYWRAIVDRWHGIGGHRVKVFYDRFATAFGKNLALFEEDDTKPRLRNLPKSDMDALRADVDELVEESPAVFELGSSNWNDWQALADMIITRYASRIRYMLSDHFAGSAEALHGELERTLSPFIDFDNRNLSEEVEHCTHHFLPKHVKPCLASEAITETSRTVCQSLFEALQSADPSSELLTARADPFTILRDLQARLAWTVWEECGTCAADELCFVPIWPFGTKEDHEHPSCHNVTVAASRNGYWGQKGIPRIPGLRSPPKPPLSNWAAIP